MPKLSVIIPSYNEREYIEKCLQSIRNNTYQNYELIVVDGGSTDNTVEVAERYADRAMKDFAQGPAFARNIGARQSAGEIVVFTDSDTLVPEDWLANIAKDFEDPDVSAVGGPVKTFEDTLLDRIVYKVNSDWLYRLTAMFGFYQLSGNNCAYRKTAFIKAGGFNEKMSMIEDTELSMRMPIYGRVIVDPKVYVWTSPRRMREKGYFRVFIKYMVGYFKLFTGQKVDMQYFKGPSAPKT